ncbi:AEC family transporter [Desulfobacter hydrogenophilus]|uniref:AEC family transporter n=1 Tax=Desulfobacter hydrogenophilus TaxID=2291 RepID=A0A328FL07_9BACT|nr:AEC family transporter [Desulfobacter hydrogenophilus]NDY70571.1 AEC family transporter [Desulfobacter hydrogenophilus]QBH13942.1 AEC family transporter [Desulfobacter hydrogenophilus]RAM03645.1 AEC family transporter [Desulfobacter hydrogenophilus]
MFSQFFSIFFNVVTPVFVLILTAYFFGNRLGIHSRSLSRTSYYLLVPAFVFNVLSQVKIDAVTAFRMMVGIGLVYMITGLLGWILARGMGRSKEISTAFLMTCIFGNVGNYGLALTKFCLGPDAMESATIYMLTANTFSFFCCVMAAGWLKGGGTGAFKDLIKTPGITIVPLALIFPVAGIAPPIMVQRIAGLLGDAMIPVLLLALGLQLKEAGKLNFGIDVFLASLIRLIAGPAIAFAMIPLVGISGIEASAGILQAAMPSAVLTAIIAMENDVAPTFVTSVICVSTLLSLVTLTVVMSLL